MKIHVCTKIEKDKYHSFNPGGDHYNLHHIETIDRKPFHKGFVGNFVPHYCRYQGGVYLVHGGIDSAYIHGEPQTTYIVIND